ncbi:hypothetical protein [Sphingomonas sp. 1P08PE]|uniref:hypothetical protein n=1 Tax=Sphingomonas sp. 1P08PE TaxID=554122 RepID=UPI00399F932D
MKFVIVTSSFDDRSGGVVVLHLLAQRLADLGATALLWPDNRPRLQYWRNWTNPRRYVSWLLYHLAPHRRAFDCGPFDTKLASIEDVNDETVVVYPETVNGNPLRARHVARWFLHKPGFHTKHLNYGQDDLFFYYQEAFYNPELGDYKDNRLAITWWNQEYRQFNYGDREGSCYLIRKGTDIPLVHDLRGSILIDPLSHRQKAEAFNRTKYFYTYDPYTLYARYAALCGCIPIVVPRSGMTREQWVPYEEERYGLAYGEEDIGWAVDTRDLLLRQITLELDMEAAMVRSFIEKCRAEFFAPTVG